MCLALAAPGHTSAQDARGALLAAFETEIRATPKRSRTVLQLGDHHEVQEVDVILPDRMRVTIEAGGTSTTTLVIGRTLFVKDGSGWRPVPIHRRPVLDSSVALLKDALADNLRGVVAGGAELLQGVATTRYEFNVAGPGSFSLAGTTMVWVEQARRVPVQVRFTGTWNGVPYQSVQRIDYDAVFQIEPPV